MAADRGAEKKGAKENRDGSPGKALSSLAEMCKKNGIKHTYQCNEKSCKSLETKRSKSAKPLRVNGVSELGIKPSIPTLRSRGCGARRSYRPDSDKKNRRSSRLDRQETTTSLPPLYSKAEKCEFVTRITDSNSNDCSALSLCMPDMTRLCEPQSGSTMPVFPPNSTSSSLLLLPMATKSLSTATGTCNTLQRTSCSDGSSTHQTQKKHVICYWKNCNEDLDAYGIIDHITQRHVDIQRDSEFFVCLWEGCKVYNKSSCSKTWLERHILCHGGDKPFRCIVDGCSVRFTSRSGLERHVNSHFDTYQPLNSRGAKSKEDTPTKLLKRRRLKRGRICTVKADDYFDSRVMESIRHQLILFGDRTEMDDNGSRISVTFQSSVIAKRTEESGKVKVLLRWQPEHIFADEWVPESQWIVQSTRVLPLSCLPRDTVTNLDSSIYNTFRYRKHRRK